MKCGAGKNLMREKSKRIRKTGSKFISDASIRHHFILNLLVVLLMATALTAGNVLGEEEKNAVQKKTPNAKELSGMSIVGNDEAPKSLYIVPWKSSEIGEETSLNAMLNEKDMPVDMEVFKRQIEFYRVSTGGRTR